ncbi:MAG: sulfatase-like hydrolase/transferase [Acidobacteria bacterium]|nr:sulfatase-like hydrolase/transferase [Acidobacteriota bacterium]
MVEPMVPAVAATAAGGWTRRQVLAAGPGAVMAAPTMAAQTIPASGARRPNLLFLIADDHAGYVLGANGNPLAETPHLDRLAGEGTRFAQHFCNSPVCTPSRQSLLTGKLPHAAGVTRLPTPLDPAAPTLAKQLKKAGYATAVFGKMHFNQPGRPGLHGFDVCMTEREIQQGWLREVKPRPLANRVKPEWRPFQDPARVWLNADQLPYGRVAGEMRSDYCVAQALKWLDAQPTTQPWALWVSLQEPHSPFDFPVEDYGHFDPARFTPPRVGPEDAWQIPKIFRPLTDEDKRGIIAAYYTSARFLDRNMGRVLDHVRSKKLEENTLTVYTADHGYSLGHHGRFEKHCGYTPAMHVPLLLRWPGKIKQQAVTHLTEHLDLTPTVTELLGIDPVPGAQGQNLLSGEPRESLFCEYLENEEAFVRTERWKYIFCSGRRARGDGYDIDQPTPGRYHRLYDLKSDPGEFTDVVGKFPLIVNEMQSHLLERFRATHPEAEKEPGLGGKEAALEFYVRPRDV